MNDALAIFGSVIVGLGAGFGLRRLLGNRCPT